MNRFIVLVALLLGPVLINGLFSCEDSCGEAYRYRIGDYKLALRRVEPQSPNKYPLDSLQTAQPVSYQEVELFISGTEQQVASLDGSDGSTLLACNPVHEALDRISALAVVSNQAYSTSLPAGSDLSSIVSIGQGGSGREPLSVFLTDSYQRAESLISLRLTQAPDRAEQHEFTIRIELSRGPSYTLRSKAVTITP